jgi:hypothetical protein
VGREVEASEGRRWVCSGIGGGLHMDRRRRYFEEEKDRFLLLYRRLGAEAAARYVCASLSGGGRTPQRRRCTDIGKKIQFFLI